MNQDYIGALKLHISAPARAFPSEVRETAYNFTRSVLEQVAASLVNRARNRLVFVRHMKIHWSLANEQLKDEDSIRRYADDIIERLENEEPVALPVKDQDVAQDVAIFENEAHWRAAHLVALATKRCADAWFFESSQEEGDPLDYLNRGNRRVMAWEVLEQVAGMDLLAKIIPLLPRPKLIALATNLFAAEDFLALPQVESALEAADASMAARLAAVATSLPRDVPEKVVFLVLRAYAHRWMGQRSTMAHVNVNEAMLVAARDRNNGDRQPHETRRSLEPRTLSAGLSSDQAEDARQTALEQEECPEEVQVFTVQAGGLFYLLNCALELNIGEILWEACLPESQVLANAAAFLLGDELSNDPAVALFSGTTPGASPLSVTPEQQEEVSRKLLTALSTALPRRGLADFPQVLLRLVPRPSGNLLVVTPVGSPFVLFAWPAKMPESVCAGLEAFLETWPKTGPVPLASSLLVDLDDSGRLSPALQVKGLERLVLPEEASPWMTVILAQVLGLLCYVLEARAGINVSPTPRAFVERYVQVLAQVQVQSHDIAVLFLAEKVDLSLRRAGFDRDPGRVPWLQRTVRFEFGP